MFGDHTRELACGYRGLNGKKKKIQDCPDISTPIQYRIIVHEEAVWGVQPLNR